MSRNLTRAAVLVVLLCGVVFAGVRGAPLAHASPSGGGVVPVRQAGQVYGGSETYTVPCMNRTQTCTITHTWRTVITVNATGPNTVINPGGGSCTSGSTTHNSNFTHTAFGLTYWTVKMAWNFNWSNCIVSGSPYIDTTFFDYSCSANLQGSCSPVQNASVSLFSCPGTACNGLAHADFFGSYFGGGTWSAFMRTAGDIQGDATDNNTITT